MCIKKISHKCTLKRLTNIIDNTIYFLFYMCNPKKIIKHLKTIHYLKLKM